MNFSREFDFSHFVPDAPEVMIVWNNDPSSEDAKQAHDDCKVIIAIFFDDPEGALAVAERVREMEHASYVCIWHFYSSWATSEALPANEAEAREWLLKRIADQEDSWFPHAGTTDRVKGKINTPR